MGTSSAVVENVGGKVKTRYAGEELERLQDIPKWWSRGWYEMEIKREIEEAYMIGFLAEPKKVNLTELRKQYYEEHPEFTE